jgi:iron complex outermembrane receptor protein
MLLCCAALPALAVSAAYAQDPQVEDEIEESDVIVVRGIRKGIEDSLAAKKNTNSIIEAISAEDIGKLPDLSIADSLARLPGVTAQRVRGRPQGVSIRGLGPAFSVALLNGREQVSANNNRGIEFDQYPAELVGQAIVYKTPDATLAATGIAGAIDIRTLRPLDYSDRRVTVSGRYIFNDQDQRNPDFDREGFRLFGSYIDQFANDTIGISLGVTRQSNPTQFTSRELKTNPGQVGRTPDGVLFPVDNPRSGAVSRDFERTSVAGTLQFQPNDRFQTTLDAFYTDTEDSGIFRGVETPLARWAGVADGGGGVFPTVTGSGPFADSATYFAGFDQDVGIGQIVRTDTEGTEAEILSLGINSTFDVTERFSLMVDFSNSSMDRNDIDYESYAGTGRGILGGFDFGNGVFSSAPRDPSLVDITTLTFDDDGEYSISSPRDFTSPDEVLLTDPGGWGQVGFIKEPNIEDELNQLRLEADYGVEKFGFSNIKIGYLYTDREKNFDSNESFLRATDAFVDGSLAIPSDAIVGSTDSGSIGLDVIAYDPSSFLTDGTYDVEKGNFDTEWVVNEEIHTFYMMADIDTLFAGLPLRGNVGFQYIETNQSSTGTLAGGEQTVEFDYDDFLPSLNLGLELVEDTFIRFSFAETITRARMDDLAANQNISFNSLSCADSDDDQRPDTFIDFNPPAVVCFNLGGGNPFLQPYRSTSYDLSFEKYLSPASAITIAVFHKEFSDWVQGATTFVDATQQIQAFGSGDFLAANPQLALASLSGPSNVAEGSLTGIEIAARLYFGDFIEPLEGFGIDANYAYNDSELEFDGTPISIPGYSDETAGISGYYERYGFRARVSGNYRSGFRDEVLQFDGALIGADARGRTLLDAQVGYEFQGGPLEGVTVLLEGYNLTDAPYITENELVDANGVSFDFPSRHELYGPSYNIAVAYSF